MRHRYCLFGLALLVAGCVYVPSFKPSPTRIVGDSRSHAVFKDRVATRQAIKDKLGEPSFRTEHERALGYAMIHHTGSWPLLSPGPCGCAGPYPILEEEWLFLEFDSNGVLVRHVSDPSDKSAAWKAFIAGVDDPDTSVPPAQ